MSPLGRYTDSPEIDAKNQSAKKHLTTKTIDVISTHCSLQLNCCHLLKLAQYLCYCLQEFLYKHDLYNSARKLITSETVLSSQHLETVISA